MHDYVKQTAASLLNQASALLALADPPKNRSYCFCKSIRAIVFLQSEPYPETASRAGKKCGASVVADRTHMVTIGQRGGKAKKGYRERQAARGQADLETTQIA